MKQQTLDKYEKVVALVKDGMRIEDACKKIQMSVVSYYNVKKLKNHKIKVYNVASRKTKKPIPVRKESPILIVYPSQLREVLAAL